MRFIVEESQIFGQDPARSGYVDYLICRTLTNLYAGTLDATGATVEVIGPNDEVLVSQDIGAYERSMGYLGGYSGCRGTVRDSNRAHPVGVRYRLRYTVVYDDGVSGTLEGEAAVVAR